MNGANNAEFLEDRRAVARKWSATSVTIVLVWLTATPLVGQAPGREDLPALADGVHRSLASMRGELGLEPLRRNELLDDAAQRKVDHSVQGSYFGFISPDGVGLDHWLSEVGYDSGMAGEKLAEANRPVAEIVASWLVEAERNASSVFHPDMFDVGVGVARTGMRHRVLVIVAVSKADRARSRLSLLTDAEAIERSFLEQLNALRERAAVPPVEAQQALRAAARELAAERSWGQVSSSGRREIEDLLRRIRGNGYRVREAQQLIASGPTSVDELCSFWFTDAASQEVLLRRWLMEAGLAVEIADGPEGPVVVWVLTMARPGRG